MEIQHKDMQQPAATAGANAAPKTPATPVTSATPAISATSAVPTTQSAPATPAPSTTMGIQAARAVQGVQATQATPAAPRPVVLVPADNRVLGKHPSHLVGRKYVDAVRLAGCLPLVVPSAAPTDIDELLALADGVFLTGSPSNVGPAHFGQTVHDATLPLDPERDAWTLPLIPRALALGVPLFGICRGLQEVNVALGGSLHQAVQEVPGYADHRDPAEAPLEVQYGPAHEVRVVPGGLLHGLLGAPGSLCVNSLHGQGVDRLAAGARVEALAPDGLVEAFSMPDTPAFNLCVQWHPEWQAASDEVSMKLLAAFGSACRARHARRTARGAAAKTVGTGGAAAPAQAQAQAQAQAREPAPEQSQSREGAAA